VDEYAANVWTDDLFDFGDGVRGARLARAAGRGLVAAVWELDAGATSGPYHLHHGTDEYLVVLRGRPTLRTPDAERELAEGDVATFPRGRDGAHQLMNRTDGVVRYLIAAAHGSPEVIEYPDRSLLVVGSKTPSLDGSELFTAFRTADAVDPADRSG
jgi:uncharacterized cupin superfamily protein